MKTITVNVYSFSELSEGAKEKVINKYRENNYDTTPWYIEEANESFEKFADIFSIDWSSIDYCEPYRNEYSIKLDDNIINLTGHRLAKYIWNNYKRDIFKGKYYGKLVDTFADGTKIPISKEHPIGQRHVKRYSKVFLSNDCVLTGVCYDQSVLQPIYDFLDKPSDIDFETLLDDCIYNLCTDVRSETEYHNSDEAITEEIEANEYEFDESGNMI